MSEHTHCWHGDMVQIINPPIVVLRCCWCGQEQRESMGFDRVHGPHAHREALQAEAQAGGTRGEEAGT